MLLEVTNSGNGIAALVHSVKSGMKPKVYLRNRNLNALFLAASTARQELNHQGRVCVQSLSQFVSASGATAEEAGTYRSPSITAPAEAL